MAAAPLLDVQGLRKEFPVRGGWLGRARATVRAVDDVSFRIERGGTLGLVGESGCGKSTTARLVLRLLEPDGGRVVVDGADIFALAPAELRAVRRRMQIVFQDPYGSLNPRMSVPQTLAEPLVIHGLVGGRAEREQRIAGLLEEVGLDRRLADSYPHELSGGQRQRVGIARALSVEP
ncbi:MAG: ATP-binding cassette domain-containing protein, partial [Gaiellales bacterium]